MERFDQKMFPDRSRKQDQAESPERNSNQENLSEVERTKIREYERSNIIETVSQGETLSGKKLLEILKDKTRKRNK